MDVAIFYLFTLKTPSPPTPTPKYDIILFALIMHFRLPVKSVHSTTLYHMVYSTDTSKAVVPVLVLLFVALWFILRGDLCCVLPCVILFLCFSVLLALRLPRLGKRDLILVLFVRLFDLRLFGFVCFLFLLVSRKGCGCCMSFRVSFCSCVFQSF